MTQPTLPSSNSGFRFVDEELRYEGHVISLAIARFEAPDGSNFVRDVVHHPGAVSVVPLLATGEVILVRQYRAAIRADLLEIPAGKRDVPGEAPQVTAERELREEIGYEANHLELLAQFHNSPGFCDEHSYVFLGSDLQKTHADRQGIEEEHMTIVVVALDEVPAMIARAEITDAKTIIGLTLALRHLDR